jgi:hypothetical protein
MAMDQKPKLVRRPPSPFSIAEFRCTFLGPRVRRDALPTEETKLPFTFSSWRVPGSAISTGPADP